MYTNLTFSGIKGTSQTIQLDSVIVVTGPNESGKSAAASALQLAATGRCEIGAQASSQQKWISGKAASISAWGKGIEAQWRMAGGKKHWEDPETQGGLPATVEDFWGLTGVERLRLVAPDGALASIESTISSLEKRKKELKTIIDAPAPPPPEQYEGEPVGVLEQRVRELEKKISDAAGHEKALKEQENFAVWKKSMEESLAENKKKLSEALEMIKQIDAEEPKLNEQLAIYQEACASIPRIAKSAGDRGVTLRAAVSDTMKLVEEVLRWCNIKETAAIASLVDKVPDRQVEPIKEPLFESALDFLNGKPLSVAHRELVNAKSHYSSCARELQSGIDSAEKALLSSPPGITGEPMSLEDVMAAQAEIGNLKQEINKANSWSAYNEALARQMEQRNKAFVEMEKVDHELAVAKKKLTDTVSDMKGPVEAKANEMLKAAGRSPLFCEVNQTGRGWSLDVSIDGIDISALAKSKKLLYGLCLLAAIHELSAAKAPVLLVECAEMDPDNLHRAIEAMRTKKKGNVILEHWSKPNSDVHVVDLSCGVLV